MTRLTGKIAALNKQKRVLAVIIDILATRCSVRIANTGNILTNLGYIGPQPIVGQFVYVDYTSGSPIVLTNDAGQQTTAAAAQAVPTSSGGSVPKTYKPPVTETQPGYHNDLPGLQGGLAASDSGPAEYYHLTEAEYAALGENGGHIIQEESVDLPTRTNLNFVGTGIEATDDAYNDATVITLLSGDGQHIIQEEGANLPARTNLNFVGASVTAADDEYNDATVVTINASGLPGGGTTGQVLTKQSDYDGDADWQDPTGGSGAPTDAEYVVASAHASLSAEIVIPGVKASPDIAGFGGAGWSEEFNGSDPFTWSATPAVADVNTTAPSHLYVKESDVTGRQVQATVAYAPGASTAFEIIAKISLGMLVVSTSGSYTPKIAVFVEDSAKTTGYGIWLRYGNFTSWVIGACSLPGTATFGASGSELTGLRTNTFYVKLTRDASDNYNFWWSPSGINGSWNQIRALVNNAFTVAYKGLMFQNSTVAGTVTEYNCDFWRGTV